MVQYLSLRLTASRLRAIKAVWNSYNDFTTWFFKASTHDSRTSKECNTFTNLTSKYFVANLALMYDCSGELQYELQKSVQQSFSNQASNGVSQKQVWILQKSDNQQALWYPTLSKCQRITQAIIDSISAQTFYLSKNYMVSSLNIGKCCILLNGQRLTLETQRLLMSA